jgi:hypothetical protein
MMRTPDGQGIELDKFYTPDAIRLGPVNAPVNTLGIRRIMFAVDEIEVVVARMCSHGAADEQETPTLRSAVLGSVAVRNRGDHHSFAVLNNKVPRLSKEICWMSFQLISCPLATSKMLIEVAFPFDTISLPSGLKTVNQPAFAIDLIQRSSRKESNPTRKNRRAARRWQWRAVNGGGHFG